MEHRSKLSRREFLYLSGASAGGAMLAGHGGRARGAGSSAQGCCVVTDDGPRSIAATPKPGYLAGYTDPAFGSRVTRVAGNRGTDIPGVSGSRWPSVARHGYSKIQAWNATQSLLALSEVQLSEGTIMLFLDGSTYRPLFVRRPGYTEVRWSHTRPDVMHWVRGNKFGTWNVRSNASTTTRTFGATGTCTSVPGKATSRTTDAGSPSRRRAVRITSGSGSRTTSSGGASTPI